MYHYVYIVTDQQTKEFYIGSRSCKCLPIEDTKYKGSQSSWVLTAEEKRLLEKKIVKSDFGTRKEAVLFEAKLIEKHFHDPLNRNGTIPSSDYHTHGKVVVKDEDGKVFCVKLNDKRYISGELMPVCKGRTLTAEHKSKISWKGKKHTEETKSKISKSQKGKKKIGKTRAKKIEQYDLMGNYIKTWKSLTEACSKLGLSAGNVSSVINGHLNQTKGFVFKLSNIKTDKTD